MLSKNLTKLGYLGRTNTQNTNIPFYDEGTPSLDLHFAGNKNLVDNVSGNNLVTFTRASSGTFVNSAGVIQTAVTNLLLRSEEFDNTTVWGNSAGTVTRNANTTIAPNGTLTADELVFAAADNSVAQAVTILNSTAYTVSIYLKGTAGQTIRVTSNGIPGGANQTLTGDWQRIVFTGTSTSTSGTLNISTFGSVTARTLSVWGAQLEQASTVGEYIPTAATINSAPRFDHNPTTGESLGLLVEEQRTNLLLRSEEFDDAAWTLLNLSAFGSGSVANATTAPDGATTADKVVEDTTPTNTHRIRQFVAVTSGTTYTFSVFAKAAERTEVSLQMTVGFASTTVAVNLLNGNVTGTTGSPIATSVTPYQNGWYRISVTQTANLTTAVAQFVIFLISSTGVTYTGDGTSGLFLWGAQLEAAAFPTSYIPTITAAVTRSADVASISGSAFSSWYRQDEGTVFSDWSTPASSEQVAWAISNGTLDESIRASTLVAGASNNTRLVVIDNNSLQAGLAVGVYTPGSRRKTALAYQQDNFAGVADGAAVVTDTSGTLPTVDRLFIGANWAGSGGFLGGPIRRFTYWPARLSDTTLQNITR
jgi:hypothetical protein